MSAVSGVWLLAAQFTAVAADSKPAALHAPLRRVADEWRAEHRLIDLHQHIDGTEEHLARTVRIMDAAGLGLGVNLSGGTVTRKGSQLSDFERNKNLTDRLCPGRFVHYMNLDYAGWDEPDFSERAAKQIEEGHRLGAAGFKEYKRLGLFLRNQSGELIRIDDPKLDSVWKKCGELGLPVSIHVADPRAFWLAYNDQNERWTELKDHRNWWFGDRAVYPPREDLLAALDRVIERNPKTTFVCVHFANNAEDIDWVDQMLDRHSNMNADLAARIPELGRHDPDKVRRLFVKHQDRIFFGTDFQVYNRLTLGSGGSGPPPTDADAAEFYFKHWLWLETRETGFGHMTPIQGDWTIDGIGLPSVVLRKIYFDNARRLLARSLPLPVLKATPIRRDFKPDANPGKAVWKNAPPAHLDYETSTSAARSEMATTGRALWSDKFLYLSYECPFTSLTAFEPANLKRERFGLWEKDVIEAFIAPDPNQVGRYSEYEVAPNGEKLDVVIDPPRKDFEWSSGFESAVKIDRQRKVWRAEMRIPIAAFFGFRPEPGKRWRLNLYRIDRANHALLAWNPTLNGSYHTPERFGILEFMP